MTTTEAKALRVGDGLVWTGPAPPGPIPGVVTSRSRWQVGIAWADGVEQVESIRVSGERLAGIERAR